MKPPAIVHEEDEREEMSKSTMISCWRNVLLSSFCVLIRFNMWNLYPPLHSRLCRFSFSLCSSKTKAVGILIILLCLCDEKNNLCLIACFPPQSSSDLHLTSFFPPSVIIMLSSPISETKVVSEQCKRPALTENSHQTSHDAINCHQARIISCSR